MTALVGCCTTVYCVVPAPDPQGVEAELAPAQERGAGDERRDAPDGDDGDEGGERRGQRELPVLRHHHESLQRQHRQRDDRLDTYR